MNKKGFTLVEILAVLALLSLITIITIPIISERRKEANEKEYDTIVDNITSAAKIYISNNPQVLNNISQSCIETVTIATLQTAKLLESNLVDPRDNSTIADTEHIDICVSGDEITYTFPGD